MTRDEFRAAILERDGGLCKAPLCWEKGEPHKIIAGTIWKEGDGYCLENGALLCSQHRRQAEMNKICPQAIRNWANLKTKLPSHLDPDYVYTRTGEKLERRYHWTGIRHPKTSFLSISPVFRSDHGTTMLECLLDMPLVATTEVRGISLVFGKGPDQIAKWNGDSVAHFGAFATLHNELKKSLPDHVLVFGRWSPIRATVVYKAEEIPAHPFVVSALYDTNESLWLGWPEVRTFARENGFVTVPVVANIPEFTKNWELGHNLTRLAEEIIGLGHERVVVRSVYPFHNSQHGNYMGMYTRKWVADEKPEERGKPLIEVSM